MKTTAVIVLVVCAGLSSAGVLPAPLALPYAVAPVGTSYTAHAINHAVAVPAAAPLIAAPGPLYAAHAAYSAYPAPAAYIAG
uniref:Uncharacterized protein n=1 Tax=Timema cristinae TaxID=61476 RepID=A0A7R9D8K8_TIMCR|nr:unnamed protein product [Timema cristinae]